MQRKDTKLRDVMSTDIAALDASASLRDAARLMRDQDIGCVVVEKDGQVCGVITDRDLVVRALADGKLDQNLGAVCSEHPTTMKADADVADAVRLMEEKAIRRIPIVDSGRAVGVVSIGDLAIARDPKSALGRISAASPTR